MKPSVAPTESAPPEVHKQRIVRAAILFDELISAVRAKELLENLVAGFKEDVRCELDIWNSRVLQIEWARRLITNVVALAEIVIFAQRGDYPLAPDFIEWIENLPRAHSSESPTLIAVLNPNSEDGAVAPQIREFYRAAAARQGRVFYTLTIFPDHPEASGNSVAQQS